MAKQLLNGADVIVRLEQMAGETVPERMRLRIPKNPARDSGNKRPPFGAKRRGRVHFTIVAGLRPRLVF